jgi:hypothetical protein
MLYGQDTVTTREYSDLRETRMVWLGTLLISCMRVFVLHQELDVVDVAFATIDRDGLVRRTGANSGCGGRHRTWQRKPNCFC